MENGFATYLLFHCTMQPITRAQLLNARAAYLAEQDRIALRELELKGQVAAERFYHEIQRVAQNNKATRAVSSDMPPGVAFNSMLEWIKDHFPDCDVNTVMASVHTRAVIVDWSPTTYEPDDTLEARRLEKETSW